MSYAEPGAEGSIIDFATWRDDFIGGEYRFDSEASGSA